MEPGSNQLKKVRTFHTDVAALRPAAEPAALTPKPVTSNLPPVMAPKKPEPEVTPPPPPLHAKPAPAVGKTEEPEALLPKAPKINLNEHVQKELGHLAAKPGFDPDERISVMDTGSDIVEGTIITDQKRERFKLLPAMATAVKDWFQEGKDVIEERAEAKKRATPTVTAIEDRKKVLEKAATQAALAPKDDHKKLTAKLPTDLDRQAAKAKQAVVIKKKNPEAKPSWSHFEGAPKPEPVKVPEPKPIAEEQILTTMAAPVLPPPPKPVVPAAPPAAPKSTPKVEPVEINIGNQPAPPPAATERKWRATPERRPRRWPRALAYLAGIVVVIGAIGGGVMTTVWFFGQDQGLAPTTPILQTADQAAPELLSRDRVMNLELPRTRVLLYESMMDNMEASGGITVFVWNLAGSPATSDEVLATLAWQASPAFLRSIGEISLGTLGTSPFIVARVSSFDTAFGGLLAAEDNLSSDLYPLFGEVVTETFDPATGTSTTARPAHFVDDVVRNHDVRVLKDQLESERVVYGFVNQNTVVITTDRAAFATIAEAIQ